MLLIYDQELDEEIDLDTLNLQLESDLEANLEIEEQILEEQMAEENNMYITPEDCVEDCVGTLYTDTQKFNKTNVRLNKCTMIP